jgi:hypothetical protein
MQNFKARAPIFFTVHFQPLKIRGYNLILGIHGCNPGNLEAFWTRVRFPPPPPKCILTGTRSMFGWGCIGFDRADKGAQATRQAIDVNEANL